MGEKKKKKRGGRKTGLTHKPLDCPMSPATSRTPSRGRKTTSGKKKGGEKKEGDSPPFRHTARRALPAPFVPEPLREGGGLGKKGKRKEGGKDKVPTDAMVPDSICLTPDPSTLDSCTKVPVGGKGKKRKRRPGKKKKKGGGEEGGMA